MNEPTDPIRITDLTAPQFPPSVHALREAIAPMAAACPLESRALHEQAAAETGLEDFGPRDYIDRLTVLLAALRDVPNITPLGRFGMYTQLLQLLKNRLLLVDLLRRHPEIRDITLAPPVIIAGLPRTGTTHLHNLLAAAPSFRTLPYWESVEPFAALGESGIEPRRERIEMTLGVMHQAMPLFPLMHEMTTDHVHEEIALLAVDFSTMFFETIAPVPAWESYYRTHDQTPHYRFLTLMLKALQFTRGGDRWLLKSPQHLEQLPVLAEVFPEATVVLTHRDPALIAVSMATMVAYTARAYTDDVPAVALGQSWADRIEALLAACLRDRDVLPPSRSMDVRFDDFMADNLAVAHRVFDLAGLRRTPADTDAMAAYLAAHQAGRHGRIDYRAEAVGLDLTELRERFAAYSARFL